jgi:hypothetical protein
VHIPKPGHQVVSTFVENERIMWNRDSRSDMRDSVAFDNDGNIALCGTARGIDYSNMREGDRPLLRLSACR